MISDWLVDLYWRVRGLVLRGKAPSPAEQGRWGEDMAVRHLRRHGWKILGRNVRPVWRDRRCEIDIVCRHAGENILAFVEVKTHLRRSEFAPRLWAVDRRKKNVLLRAIRSWLRQHDYPGSWRFDVIEVYGSCRSGAAPEIDHIEYVRIKPARRKPSFYR